MIFHKGDVPWNKGIPHSSETIKKILKNRKKRYDGDNNPAWKGNNVGYSGVHIWVRKHLAKPDLCEMCYIEKAIDAACVTGVYNREPTNWKFVCRKCHDSIDNRNIKGSSDREICKEVHITTISKCRSCQSRKLQDMFSLGKQAIINFNDSPDEKRNYAPLEIIQCSDCSLVQLKHSVNRDGLFRQYYYRSGANASMRAQLFDIVISAESHVRLEYGDWVADIGSNDSTLLLFYRTYIKKVGFEPAINISAPLGVKVVNNYFNLSDAQYLTKYFGRKPKIITAVAMFYDVEDPNKFLQDIKAVLHEKGIFVLQLNTLDAMVKNFTIDNISHEHLCYYSIQVLRDLLKKNGFVVPWYEENSVNGGSVRMYCRHEGFSYPRIEKLEVDWAKWRAELDEKRAKIRAIIEKERDKHGHEIWGYGASTRGYSLLQWLGIEDKITKIADRNPEKWGKFLGKIEICSEAEMRMAHPPFLFVLPYSFRNEFIEREKEYLARGGHMIFPLPSPEII